MVRATLVCSVEQNSEPSLGLHKIESHRQDQSLMCNMTREEKRSSTCTMNLLPFLGQDLPKSR